MADEDDTILQHLKGGQFFKPLSPADEKWLLRFPSLAGRSITVLQFSWYRKMDPPEEEVIDAPARINTEQIGSANRTIQWQVGSLYDQQHVQKTVYTASFYIRLD